MKKILIFLILMTSSLTSQAQLLSSSETFNFQTLITNFSVEQDHDTGNNDECTLLVGQQNDTITDDWLLDWRGLTGGIQNPSNIHCIEQDADPPFVQQFIKGIDNINAGIVLDAARIDLEYQYYENDDADRCSLDLDDDDGAERGQTVLSNLTVAKWSGVSSLRASEGHKDDTPETRMYYNYATRYHRGDGFTNALEFGEIPTGSTKDHFNNTAGPGNINVGGNTITPESELLYSNNHPDQSGPDIFYSFSVPSPGAKIELENTSTKFVMYLYDSNGNNVLASGISSLTRALCSGTYFIVLDGIDGSKGESNLTIRNTVLKIPTSGTLSTIKTDLCQNEVLPSITGTPAALDPGLEAEESISYIWEKSENGGAWEVINFETGEDFQNIQSLTMNNGPISLRRRAKLCNTFSNYTNVITFNEIPSSLSPGSIQFSIFDNPADITTNQIKVPADLSISPGNLEVDPIDPPAGNPTPITYQWQRNNNTSWVDITCGTNPSACTSNFIVPAPNTLSGDTRYRLKVSNACDQDASSEEFLLDLLDSDGGIRGKVTANGTNTGVPGVSIEVIRNNINVLGGSLIEGTYYALTDQNGEYQINDIYYGVDADFSVTPSKVDADDSVHVFVPTERSVNLTSSLKIKEDVDFIDNTTFVISGNVFQNYNGSICPMDTVKVETAGGFDFTDSNGDYSIVVPTVGIYTVTPVLNGLTFLQPSQDVTVNQNITGIDFENTDRYTISGRYSDGCGNYIGDAEITITSSNDNACISTTVITDNNGFYSASVPYKNYKVSFNATSGNTLEINAQLSQTIELEPLYQDTTINFVYRPDLSMTIEGVPSPSCLGEVLLEQMVPIDISINVFEGNNCPLDTGVLEIIDLISDRGDTTLEISDGQVIYTINPGLPNILESQDFLKNIQFTAFDLKDNGSKGSNTTGDQFDVIVLGNKPRTNTFTTTTPELPFLILRDPPGDGSFSRVLQSNTIEYSSKFFAKEDTGTNAWGEIKVGSEFSVGIGYSTEVEIEATLGTSFDAVLSSLNTTELSTSITTSTEYNTSATGAFTGDRSDIFVGSALNLFYSLTDIIDFDAKNCRLINDVDLVIAPQGLDNATTFIYTQSHIENGVIPDLIDLRNISIDPMQIEFYNDQIVNWQNILKYNEILKNNAIPDTVGNLSFSGNTSVTRTVSTTQQATESFEFFTEIEASVAAAAGIEVAGNGFSGGVKTTFRTQSGESNSLTNSSTFETSFTLQDDDANDNFAVEVLFDPVYKTPVFNLLAGESSCPWEEGTAHLDIPSIDVESNIITGITADNVDFSFSLINQVPPDALVLERPYTFEINENSFQNYSGTVRVGSSSGNSVEYSLLDGGVQLSNVNIQRNNTYSFEGLEFYLYPSCYDGNTILAAAKDELAVAKISAYFETPCSEVTLAQPIDDWFVTQADQDILPIIIQDYEVSQLNQILVQYKKIFENSFTTAAVLEENDLNDNGIIGTLYNFDVSGLDEGEYDIRLRLNCTGGITYSERVRGLIDRTGPFPILQPLPIDDNYDESAGDIISLDFSEPVDCSQITATLTDTENGEELPIIVSCIDNQVIISPQVDLAIRTASVYRVDLSNIRDLLSNLGEHYSWTFTVGEVPSGPQVLYVNAAAPAGGFGSSWDDAFNNLQDALDIATTDDQIWVAAGTYYPSVEFDLNNSGGGDIRERTFYLNIDVQLYGGFAGFETELDQRDIINNPTILSGNFGETASNADNALHVVVVDGTYGFGITKKCIIDGVIITKGFANSNAPNNSGGGIYNYGPGIGSMANPTISNTTIIDNYGILGGGMFNDGSAGGESSPCVISSWIQGNTASTCAGVFNYAFTDGTCEPSFINSIFYANEATFGGGAIQNNSATRGKVNSKVINSTFYKNRASVGAGIFQSANFSSISNQTTVVNSIFWDNQDELNASVGSITVNNSLIDDGLINGSVILPANVTGTSNIDSDPNFLNIVEGNLRLGNSSPAIDQGTIDTSGLMLPKIDFDGLPRLNGQIDLGAFENPYVNCPDILRIIPQYGDMSGSYTADQMITIEKGNDTPVVPVSLSAPEIRIMSDFTVPAAQLFQVSGTGCGNN